MWLIDGNWNIIGRSQLYPEHFRSLRFYYIVNALAKNSSDFTFTLAIAIVIVVASK